jgi:AcrR family transcriptional regulator
MIMMDAKQEHIVSIAEKIFARFGFRKTTVDEIAKAAGMGKSTLYYYFKSKEEIFAAVIRQDAQFILHKLTEAINSSVTPQEKLRNYVIARMKTIEEMSSHYEILKAEYVSFYPLIEQERKQFHQQEVGAVIGILQQGVNQGVFTLADVAATAEIVIAMLRGFEDQWFISGQASLNLEQDLNMFLNILLKGLESR